MARHHFTLEATWPGGRNQSGYIKAGNLETQVSIPPEMDGPGVGTNPDEMLLGAASTCYIITLAAMIERAELPLQHMELNSVGEVDVTNGVITYKRIIHKPTVILQKEASDKHFQRLQKIIKQAESSCMISRAIKGNVAVELEENLSVSEG